MKWAPSRNAPPASAQQLRNSLAPLEAEVNELTGELEEIKAASPGLVAEPDKLVAAKRRARDIEALLPAKLQTVAEIRAAIPDAEMRERCDRIAAKVDEQARKSAKLQRNLEARYTKAAETFAEVCREIQADADQWRGLRAEADTVRPRVPVPHRSAETALRFDRFASPNSGLKSVIDDLTVRAWDGSTLFRS